MNACMKYRMDLKDIKKLKDINIIIGGNGQASITKKD